MTDNNLNILPYNTDLKPLPLNEFGRNIQNMVDFCMTIEDRDERTRCAYQIAATMAKLFPDLVGEDKNDKVIWDHINAMSGYTLDIDFPCEVMTREKANPKPEKIPYTAGAIRFRHYGGNIEHMIKIVADMEDGEEKDVLVSMIAHQLKKLMLVHNKEGVDDAKILRDLADYSDGKIQLDPEVYLLHEFKEAKPAKTTKQSKKKKKK